MPLAMLASEFLMKIRGPLPGLVQFSRDSPASALELLLSATPLFSRAHHGA